MKTILLARAAALLVSSLGAQSAWAADVAAPEDNGIRFLLESQSSYTFLGGNALNDAVADSVTSEGESYSTSAGVARLNVDLGSGLNLQGDVFGEYAWIDDDADDTYSSTLGGGLHAYVRSDSGALGLFGALADVNIQNDSIDDPGDGEGGLVHTIGAEGLWFGEGATLGAQVGYLDSSASDDVDLIRNAVYVRGLARYFFAENTLLQAEAAYLKGEFDGDDDDINIVSVGARLQHEMDFFPGDFNWPGKVYIAYRGDFASQPDEDDKIDSHTILFGTTFTFGHDLRDNERNGAAFDLPAFARWNSIAAGPLE